jgi:ADP-glucose pyrophosphorylase
LLAIHIYKMNYRWHGQHPADITIATTQAAPEQTERFGVAEIDLDHQAWASQKNRSTAIGCVRFLIRPW